MTLFLYDFPGSTIFGGGGKTNVEHWRCVSTLRGHSGDVLDLGWSSDDRYLASSSVDNTIRVWNMLNMPESIAVLKGHTGLVKGIAWDPIGESQRHSISDSNLQHSPPRRKVCGLTVRRQISQSVEDFRLEAGSCRHRTIRRGQHPQSPTNNKIISHSKTKLSQNSAAGLLTYCGWTGHRTAST